ncbi:MAG TPA: enoyl-CoA hydratase, partial [Stellaceae bacterium]|nr:enoyl-CoA hydratase [Stellaceae bacterium]
YQSSDGIATITLHRPDRLNAWTAVMDVEVREAMEIAAADQEVRVILLTGSGRGFCAGADIERLSGLASGGKQQQPPAQPRRPRPLGGSTRADFEGRVSYLPAVGKPVIGVINGPCAGIGFVLALYCDMRIAGADAVFVSAFARRGLIAEYGIAWILPRLIGPSRALDVLLSSRKVGAEEALRMGLVDQVLPQAELEAGARAYALELARNSSPRSMRVMKRQVWEGAFQTLAEAEALAQTEMRLSFESEDFKEGVAHFKEKRAPRFTGK